MEDLSTLYGLHVWDEHVAFAQNTSISNNY